MFAKTHGFSFTKTEGSGVNFISQAMMSGKITDEIIDLVKH